MRDTVHEVKNEYFLVNEKSVRVLMGVEYDAKPKKRYRKTPK
jgi:hypothetical protein